MAAKWRRKRERRCHFKENMSLEEAYHHRRPWIRAWRKEKMNEGRGREEHGILSELSYLKFNIQMIKVKKKHTHDLYL